LFYFDQRIRKEGFDIEWMMLQAGMLQAATPAVSSEAEPEMVTPAAIEGSQATAAASGASEGAEAPAPIEAGQPVYAPPTTVLESPEEGHA
jgi:hypothetical protein